MKTIKIKIDNEVTYNIELNDEYTPDEFLTVVEQHLNKIKKLNEFKNDSQKINNDLQFKKKYDQRIESLYSQLSNNIEGFGTDVAIKKEKTMTAYYSIQKSNNKKRGLVWIVCASSNLLIYLRKGSYDKIDVNKKVTYSTDESKTFGGYPYIKVYTQNDLDYALKIIKYIYDNS